MAAHNQLTQPTRPDHARLRRSTAAASGASARSGQRRFEDEQRRHLRRVCPVLPEQPHPVQCAGARTGQRRVPTVLPEQPHPVHETQLTPHRRRAKLHRVVRPKACKSSEVEQPFPAGPPWETAGKRPAPLAALKSLSSDRQAGCRASPTAGVEYQRSEELQK
jgi:hypothetical protein